MKPADPILRVQKLSSLWGAFLCAGLSLLLWQSSLSDAIVDLSYDSLFLWRVPIVPQEATLIYLDERTLKDKHQAPHEFDRRIHAEVLDRLTQDRAKCVVFDILFDQPRPQAADSDRALAQAIARNGNVLLVSIYGRNRQAEIRNSQLLQPFQALLDAGAVTGVSDPGRDQHGWVRRFYNGDTRTPGLAWLAAQRVGSKFTQNHPEPDNRIWLNYYGPPRTLRSVSLADVPLQPPGFFKDQVVFIGSLQDIAYPQEDIDQFNTPYSRWMYKSSAAGVEIVATAFLNLLRGEGFYRMSTLQEFRILLFTGLLLGAGLVWLRPWWAVGMAGIAAAVITMVAPYFAWQTHYWFAWMIIPALQIPVALSWALFTQTRRLKTENEYLEQTLTHALKKVEQTEQAMVAAQSAAESSKSKQEETPTVADHELVRQVGKGGYGEVWLARNAVGLYHIVKLVHRRDFNDDTPYEREFRGIQKFMPISRSHPGFVHVLHVGRNEERRFFYYVMETGDDEKTGQNIQPESYSPKNLGNWIRTQGALKVAECVRLGLAMTDALDCLHRQQLIHRDIKPANIIYVGGQPKLADVGLVTEIASTDHGVSQLGTDGFMAPEGPGTPASDVYSLGKVLYEACMGLDRRRFPELPTALYESDDITERMQLNRIIIHACEPRPEDRYPTAAEMRKELLELAEAMGLKP